MYTFLIVNAIDDSGARKISKALKKNTTLTKIDITCILITHHSN